VGRRSITPLSLARHAKRQTNSSSSAPTLADSSSLHFSQQVPLGCHTTPPQHPSFLLPELVGTSPPLGIPPARASTIQCPSLLSVPTTYYPSASPPQIHQASFCCRTHALCPPATTLRVLLPRHASTCYRVVFGLDPQRMISPTTTTIGRALFDTTPPNISTALAHSI
jgi:hypothetical protein